MQRSAAGKARHTMLSYPEFLFFSHNAKVTSHNGYRAGKKSVVLQARVDENKNKTCVCCMQYINRIDPKRVGEDKKGEKKEKKSLLYFIYKSYIPRD